MKLKSKRLTTLRLSRRKKVLASAILAGLMTSGWTSVAEAGCSVAWWGWYPYWKCTPDPVYIPPTPQINPTPQVNAGSNMDVEVGQVVNFNGSFTD